MVDSGSFTRTADMLSLPRSTVSAALQELEKRLGTQLIYRTTRKLTPSPDGLAFYATCSRLVSDMEEAEALFRSPVSAITGQLRVNVPSRIGRLLITPHLPDFLARYPALTIDLGVTDRRVNLIEEGVDCVLRVGELADSHLISQRVGEVRLINVASPAYLARFGTPQSPDDLHAHQAVNYASSPTSRAATWSWQAGAQEKSLPIAARLTVNDAESYIAACLAGLGLIQVPAYDVQSYLKRGELIEVMPQHQPQPMPMTLIYHRKQHLSRRLKAFIEHFLPILCGYIKASDDQVGTT